MSMVSIPYSTIKIYMRDYVRDRSQRFNSLQYD